MSSERANSRLESRTLFEDSRYPFVYRVVSLVRESFEPCAPVLLHTPPFALIVDLAVFDGWRWCEPTVLEWRSKGPLRVTELTDDPAEMAFVLRRPWPSLPTELARLHIGRAYGLTDELCLAPFAIDDATDQCFEQRVEPHSAFWLGTDHIDGLYWGLHDWAHFHHHGDFSDPSATELQCDFAAIYWLWLNRSVLPMSVDAWELLHSQVVAREQARRKQHPPVHSTSPEKLANLRIFREITGTSPG